MDMETTAEEQQQRASSFFSNGQKALAMTLKKPEEEHSPEKEVAGEANEKQQNSEIMKSNKKQPGGWKTMPFIIGNETFERLASFGLGANFMVYLRKQYHLNQVAATRVIMVYSGVSNFLPLLGAFVSDSYSGRFWAIAFGSVFTLSGMMCLTLTAGIPTLRPPPCPYNNPQFQTDQMGSCEEPNGHQMWFLVLTLGLLCIGGAGIRPCSLPFGVDQFDHTTEEGRRGISSYFNWYYTTFTLAVMIALTVIVYIQDSISWVIGFTIPTVLMFGSIILFFFGRRLYVYVKPEGSVFSSIFRVFVAAYNKRHLSLPYPDAPKQGIFYDPPPRAVRDTKLSLTSQFTFLNKAAVIQEGEMDYEGKPTAESKWTLCSIQEIEEVKCLMRVFPIWVSGIISFTVALQQSTISTSQAMAMNRNIGPKFQIPAGSIGVISMLAVGIWVPIYDRFLVPFLRRFRKHGEGITLLERMGTGLVFAILAMIIAGLVEQKRRNLANLHHQNLSIAWLVPQLVLVGLAEAFNFIGQIEFYNKQFPENLSSLATSVFSCTIASASYLNMAVVSILHKVTGRHGKPDWLVNDINQGRLDYFYYVVAMMGCVNLVYFLVCASKYRYKASPKVVRETDFADIELSLAT